MDSVGIAEGRDAIIARVEQKLAATLGDAREAAAVVAGAAALHAHDTATDWWTPAEAGEGRHDVQARLDELLATIRYADAAAPA